MYFGLSEDHIFFQDNVYIDSYVFHWMNIVLPVVFIVMCVSWWFVTKVACKMNKVGFTGGKK